MVQPSMLKSHKHSKMIETHFLSIVFHNDWLQNHCLLSAKGMTPNFVVFVSVLPPNCCHIGWAMPYLCIFVEEVVTLLGAITDFGYEHLSVVRIRT